MSKIKKTLICSYSFQVNIPQCEYLQLQLGRVILAINVDIVRYINQRSISSLTQIYHKKVGDNVRQRKHFPAISLYTLYRSTNGPRSAMNVSAGYKPSQEQSAILHFNILKTFTFARHYARIWHLRTKFRENCCRVISPKTMFWRLTQFSA